MMSTRHDHLLDLKKRLDQALRASAITCPVYIARVKTLDVDQMPAICLYAPEEHSGEAQARGLAPQFRPRIHLAIEVRVALGDGFDVAAGRLLELVKTALYCDPAWLARYDRYPTWSIHQYLDRRGEDLFCGEVMTIAATARHPADYPPVAPLLSAVDIKADLGGVTVETLLTSP